MSDEKKNDVLLKVENLSMYFGKGAMTKKAISKRTRSLPAHVEPCAMAFAPTFLA